jgi:hypothetical protein
MENKKFYTLLATVEVLISKRKQTQIAQKEESQYDKATDW